MIELGNKIYKLILCDTNIISKFIKGNLNIRNGFKKLILEKNYFICFSFSGLTELYKREDLFDRFIDIMNLIPIFFLHNHNQIIEEEIKNYGHNTKINPIYLHFKALQKDEEVTKIKDFFFSDFIKQKFDEENNIETRKSILKDLLSWKKGYPEPDNGYSKKDIEEWVNLVLLKKLSIEYRGFLLKNNLVVNLDKLPSWKMVSFLTFYKFYINNKKPKISDLGDILMSANFPYVDAIIVEKNVKEIVRQIQVKHKFVPELELFDINSFN